MSGNNESDCFISPVENFIKYSTYLEELIMPFNTKNLFASSF